MKFKWYSNSAFKNLTPKLAEVSDFYTNLSKARLFYGTLSTCNKTDLSKVQLKNLRFLFLKVIIIIIIVK
jgi:hypothetical protein